MLESDEEFNKARAQEIKAREAACKVLGVGIDAGPEALKAAYRSAVMKFHPDRNPGDSDAERKFILVKCAYELLDKGEPCGLLLSEIGSWPEFPGKIRNTIDDQYEYFIWWKNIFFE